MDVEGWVRDAPLSLNRLVHVRGVGAARIVHCEVYSTSEATTPSATLQGTCDEPLKSAATPDELMGEQNLENMEEGERPRKHATTRRPGRSDDDDDDDNDGIDVDALNTSTGGGGGEQPQTLQERDEDDEFPDGEGPPVRGADAVR